MVGKDLQGPGIILGSSPLVRDSVPLAFGSCIKVGALNRVSGSRMFEPVPSPYSLLSSVLRKDLIHPCLDNPLPQIKAVISSD